MARELMLQSGQHGIVVSVPVIAEEVHIADAGIESGALHRSDGVFVEVEIGMTRQACLIAQGRYKLVAQVVLRVQREMLGIHRGKIRGEGSHPNLTSRWQSVRAKADDRIRVRRVAEERLRIARNRIDHTGIRRSRRSKA